MDIGTIVANTSSKYILLGQQYQLMRLVLQISLFHNLLPFKTINLIFTLLYGNHSCGWLTEQ